MNLNQVVKEVKKIRSRVEKSNRFAIVSVFYNTSTHNFDVKDATFERFEYPALDWVLLANLKENISSLPDTKLKEYLFNLSQDYLL